MNDVIDQLLRDADAASATDPPQVGELGSRVRMVARRRRIVRRALGAAAACVLVVSTVTALLLPTAQSPRKAIATEKAAAPSVRDDRDELIALRAEADRQAMLAERMMASERAKERIALQRRTMASPDPAQQARQKLERAALTMVYQADRLAARDASTAEQVYAAAVANFPGTHWADVARERLTVVRERKDGSG